MIYVVSILVLLFLALWIFAPKSTMSHIWAVTTAVFTQMGPIFEYLSNEVPWDTIVSHTQAVAITTCMAVAFILTRIRGFIKGTN